MPFIFMGRIGITMTSRDYRRWQHRRWAAAKQTTRQIMVRWCQSFTYSWWSCRSWC